LDALLGRIVDFFAFFVVPTLENPNIDEGVGVLLVLDAGQANKVVAGKGNLANDLLELDRVLLVVLARGSDPSCLANVRLESRRARLFAPSAPSWD
jgi:hypothetical protein